MAKKFTGDYKGVPPEQLPVFTVTIVIQNLRTGKFSSNASATFMERGVTPSFRKLARTSVKEMRDTVCRLEQYSAEADQADDAAKEVRS